MNMGEAAKNNSFTFRKNQIAFYSKETISRVSVLLIQFQQHLKVYDFFQEPTTVPSTLVTCYLRYLN